MSAGADGLAAERRLRETREIVATMLVAAVQEASAVTCRKFRKGEQRGNHDTLVKLEQSTAAVALQLLGDA